jgi:hypothetical protein
MWVTMLSNDPDQFGAMAIMIDCQRRFVDV